LPETYSGKKVSVIGGGPAGIAATYVLAKKGVPVCCFEADAVVGGISRTIEYKGFRFDIGGHRFFSKYDRVNALWQEVLGDEFLIRPRLSRIYYNGKFFNYPLQVGNALSGLGLILSLKILSSYCRSRISPIRPEENFEDWVSNRFGRQLYSIFFKTYTEKVWGIPCNEIRAEWAAQRIKGLSLWSAVKNALFGDPEKKIKTLINEFSYPRLGPGQMYETMAKKAVGMGADLCLLQRVVIINHQAGKIVSAEIVGPEGPKTVEATDIISTMPITDLVLNMRPKPPEEVAAATKKLRYRSLLTVNLLLRVPQQLPDTWLYVHDPSVRLGRVQCFANWSPFMVPDKEHSSLGLEYFCTERDELWEMEDDELIALAREEIGKLGLARSEDVFDGFVVRMPKCYPVYDGEYRQHLDTIRTYLSGFENLQLCGRYGLFKYNNMDHSMLTAMLAVENVLGADHDVWEINADDAYHEEGK
jgi:protoporphyrinogen oxidase